MSEYNIQMNKYNALNAEYDQLYPQPMKHASTHASGGIDSITPGDIGAYSKEESISASTRTALSLASTATPDDALAEIAQKLSESGGLTLVKLWENASLNSIFSAQSLSFDTNYNAFLVEFSTHISLEARSLILIVSKNVKYKNISMAGTTAENGGNAYPGTRNFTITDSGATFENGYSVKGAGNWSQDDAFCIPSNIFGIVGIQIS